ncbi:MAG: class I SAM-dependent methyltransferase [Bacteroidota bacterium]
MSKTSFLPTGLHAYLIANSLRESEILKRLRKETTRIPQSTMQISPEQGQFLAMLVKLMGATRTLEIGVFTGYSTLCVASALPPNGTVVACDMSEEWTSIARRYWTEAGVDQKIELHLGAALTTLGQLIIDGKHNSFDFAFIDADKKNLWRYYELCLTLIRPGGLIAVDNVLWSGRVTRKASRDADTRSIRTFNRKVRTDDRVDISMLSIADGMTLLRKNR